MWRSLTLMIALLLLPLGAGAQFDIGSLGGPALTLSLDPEYPSPGQPFTATLADYSSSFYGAAITWTYGGEVVEAGNNQRSVDLVAGGPGEARTLTASLVLPSGGSESASRTITPVYLDVIFEPQTRTPDWYLGRALPSLGAQVNAVALLSAGSLYNSSNVVYTWRVDQRVLEGGPIRGGNRVSFDTPRGGGATVRVTATDLSGNVIASRAVRMQSVTPELHFYEKHALYGQQHIPLQQNHTLVGNALTIQAEPYFLDTRVFNQPDVAEWQIDSRTTDNGSDNPYEISLTRAGNGQTLLNFHVRSLREVLQGDEANLRINL